MLYAKIKNETVIKFPFTVNDLYEENPYTNYGGEEYKDLISLYSTTEQGIEGNYLVEVVITDTTPQFDQFTQKLELSQPSLNEEIWQSSRVAVDMNEDEKAAIQSNVDDEIAELDEEILFAQTQKAKASNKEEWDSYVSKLQEAKLDMDNILKSPATRLQSSRPTVA